MGAGPVAAVTLAFGDEAHTTARRLIEPLAERGALSIWTDRQPPSGEAASSTAPLLWVESGVPWLPPPSALVERPTAAWIIDTHRGMRWRAQLAAGFGHAFVAQRGAVAPLQARGIHASWLPLAASADACDPGPLLADRPWDVAFVGAAPPGSFRRQLLEALESHHRVAPWDGFVEPTEMMERYRSARVVLNVPVADDLNMRAFEATAARARLVTGPMDGLEEVLPEGAAVVVPDRDLDRWLAAVSACLADPDGQGRADAAHDAVVAHHTYDHRVDEVLRVLGDGVPQIPEPTIARAHAAAYARWGRSDELRALGLPPLPRVAAMAAATSWRLLRALRRTPLPLPRRGTRF